MGRGRLDRDREIPAFVVSQRFRYRGSIFVRQVAGDGRGGEARFQRVERISHCSHYTIGEFSQAPNLFKSSTMLDCK